MAKNLIATMRSFLEVVTSLVSPVDGGESIIRERDALLLIVSELHRDVSDVRHSLWSSLSKASAMEWIQKTLPKIIGFLRFIQEPEEVEPEFMLLRELLVEIGSFYGPDELRWVVIRKADFTIDPGFIVPLFPGVTFTPPTVPFPLKFRNVTMGGHGVTIESISVGKPQSFFNTDVWARRPQIPGFEVRMCVDFEQAMRHAQPILPEAAPEVVARADAQLQTTSKLSAAQHTGLGELLSYLLRKTLQHLSDGDTADRFDLRRHLETFALKLPDACRWVVAATSDGQSGNQVFPVIQGVSGIWLRDLYAQVSIEAYWNPGEEHTVIKFADGTIKYLKVGESLRLLGWEIQLFADKESADSAAA